ncbi:MAG: hypothetical protein JWQ95_632 [Sphaerisporangium sp.]|nr:hypothetical protein [Sphaerisporangium sp.]
MTNALTIGLGYILRTGEPGIYWTPSQKFRGFVVTRDKVLTIGGVPAHQRLTRMRGRLARHLVDRFVSDIAQYRRLPPSELAEDIVAIVEDNLHALATVIRDRRVPQPGELGGQIAESAARGAEQGMPPAALLSAYHLAFAETWRALVADAGPDDLPDVLACTDLVFEYLRRVTEAVSATYFEERRRMSSEDQDARYRLISALLSGEPSEGLAARAGLSLAPSYLVMNLAIEESGTLAGRRRLHRMQHELDGFGDEPVLSLLDAAGGTVLVPCPLSGDVGTLVERLSTASRTHVTAAVAEATPDQVPAQVRQTQEILHVVQAFGRGPGVYRLSDVLVEYQLTRPSAATPELAAVLDALDDHPELLGTLRVHLQYGNARRRTAASLHIHPNTVDYRLRRAAELIGLDPADPAHLQKIAAAFAARRAIA